MSESKQLENIDSSTQRTLFYLIELRSRLITFLCVFILLFSGLLFFSNALYTLLALPLLKFLPSGHLIATQITSPIFVPFKLAFFVATLLITPFFLYQIWAFISPALYGAEKRLVWPVLCMSVILFYAGVAFAYAIIFPMLFHFIAQTAPVGVLLSPDISEYFDLTVKLLLIFGFLFEIPMVLVLLVSTGILTRTQLIKWRPYAILSSFIIGMLLAPPDVVSQTLIALPIWGLYEAGLLILYLLKR